MSQNKKEASEAITKSIFFQALNRQVVDDIYQSDWRPKTWKGFRLCAIDGTLIRLPNELNITEYFGFQKGREGSG